MMLNRKSCWVQRYRQILTVVGHSPKSAPMKMKFAVLPQENITVHKTGRWKMNLVYNGTNQNLIIFTTVFIYCSKKYKLNNTSENHNYCRMPLDEDNYPWCYVAVDRFGFCNVPICDDCPCRNGHS